MRTAEPTLAGRLERFLAYLLDSLLAFVGISIVIAPLDTPSAAMAAAFLCQLAYSVMFTSSGWQATPGQRLLSIRIVRNDGRRLDRADALQRFLAYIMPTLPMHASFIDPQLAPMLTVWLSGIWFAPILLREERTGIHDMLCGTRVVVGRTGVR